MIFVRGGISLTVYSIEQLLDGPNQAYRDAGVPKCLIFLKEV